MIALAIIMFLTALVFAVVGVLIYRGNVNLIHAYHQTKVKDRAAYGKAFGKALVLMAASMAVSGGIALFGSVGWALGVLALGLTAGVILIIRIQKRHNGGIF